MGCSSSGLSQSYRQSHLGLFEWLVDPHHLWLAPAAGGSALSTRMFLPGLLVEKGAPPAEFGPMAAVTLVRRHELDAAVTVLLVVQSTNDTTHSQASALLVNGLFG